jgi:hypothetical protein
LTCQTAYPSGVKKPARGGLFLKSAKNTAIYFAGAFFAGFLLFLGLAVALFMVSHFGDRC